MAHTTTVHLTSKEQHNKLVELARKNDLLITRGAGTGFLGSVSELCKALADGRLIVIKAKDGEKCTE